MWMLHFTSFVPKSDFLSKSLMPSRMNRDGILIQLFKILIRFRVEFSFIVKKFNETDHYLDKSLILLMMLIVSDLKISQMSCQAGFPHVVCLSLSPLI